MWVENENVWVENIIRKCDKMWMENMSSAKIRVVENMSRKCEQKMQKIQAGNVVYKMWFVIENYWEVENVSRKCRKCK